MPATGPHTFLDTEGEEWEITGINAHAPAYVNVSSLDTPGRTSLRPIVALAPAGLSVPSSVGTAMEVVVYDDGEPPGPPLFERLAATEEYLADMEGY